MTRILCLDDDPDTLNLLRLILTRAGYEVIDTTSSYEALDILRHQPIDLITQDFMRPELDGLEFLKIMKLDTALRDIPVLSVASRERDPWAEAMKRAGFDPDRDLAGYVTKPFGPFDLLDAVEAALTRHGKAIPPQAAQLRAKHRGHSQAETDHPRECAPRAVIAAGASL